MKSVSPLKALALLPLVGSTIGLSHAASPLLDLGDNACAYFVCDAGIRYVDNIYATHNKTDDVVFNIAPGVQIDIGRESNNRLTIKAQENLLAYVDNDNLNTQLANVSAVYKYDAGSALSAEITGSFEQTAQNDNTVFIDGDVVERNYFRGGIMLAYKITEKSSLEAGFKYDAFKFRDHRDAYNDQANYNVPVTWLYAVTDKINAGLTYQYTYTDIDPVSAVGAPNPGHQEIHFGGVTVRGALTEKINLRTNLGIGYQKFSDRNPILGGDDSGTTFNFSLAADYQVTEKLATSVEAGRRFEVGGSAQGITNTFLNLYGVYSISEQWEANANIGYSYQEFEVPSQGTDQITTAGIGISFLPNKYWRISLGYNFSNNDSDRIDNYSINTIALTASVKY